MTTFNLVLFRVNPGMERMHPGCPSRRQGRLARANPRGDRQDKERAYVLTGEWQDIAALAGARQRMIQTLDTFRHALEDLGSGLGVTDAPSGDVVLTLR